MASNIMSRLLPSGAGPPSVYETLRQNDESSDVSDVEDRAGMTLDEENLGQNLGHYELDQAEMSELRGSQAAESPGPTFVEVNNKKRRSSSSGRRRQGREHMVRPRWMRTSPGLQGADEGDDEVPASLLVEGGEDVVAPPLDRRLAQIDLQSSMVPGLSTTKTKAQWEATRIRQRLHTDNPPRLTRRAGAARSRTGLAVIDPREHAMWKWANVENLDNFLKDVYDYFLGNGIWCIVLRRALNLLFVMPLHDSID